MGLLDSAVDGSVLNDDDRTVAWLADMGSFSMAAAAAATAATVANGSPRSGCGGEWADGRDN